MLDRFLISSISSRKIRFFLLFLLFCTVTPFCLADNTSAEVLEKQRQLKDVRSNIDTINATLKSKQRSQSSLEQKLQTLELSLNAQSKSLRKLKNETTVIRRKLKKLHKKRYALEESLAQHQQSLTTQLRAAYYTGNQENLKLLLNQQDPSTLARIIKYYEYLNRARVASIQETESTLKNIKQTEQSIMQSQNQLTVLLTKKENEFPAIGDNS